MTILRWQLPLGLLLLLVVSAVACSTGVSEDAVREMIKEKSPGAISPLQPNLQVDSLQSQIDELKTQVATLTVAQSVSSNTASPGIRSLEDRVSSLSFQLSQLREEVECEAGGGGGFCSSSLSGGSFLGGKTLHQRISDLE